ncbi:reverse transcriptase zinc-binding domain-containing protein [Tanacetum coccineum]
MLEITNKIKPFVKYRIGNGKGVSMWYDNWSNVGPLNNIIPKCARNAARMKDSDSVTNLVKNSVWDWPMDWLELYLILNQVTVPDFSMNKDSVVWIEESKQVKYSLAIQEKLLTQVKMLKWNSSLDLKCPLCKICPDDHNHLFFECQYSAKVWQHMRSKGRFSSNHINLKSIVKTATDKQHMVKALHFSNHYDFHNPSHLCQSDEDQHT